MQGYSVKKHGRSEILSQYNAAIINGGFETHGGKGILINLFGQMLIYIFDLLDDKDEYNLLIILGCFYPRNALSQPMKH